MTGVELRLKAFEHIQKHPYLWGKWNDAREEHERQELMISVVALLESTATFATFHKTIVAFPVCFYIWGIGKFQLSIGDRIHLTPDAVIWNKFLMPSVVC